MREEVIQSVLEWPLFLVHCGGQLTTDHPVLCLLSNVTVQEWESVYQDIKAEDSSFIRECLMTLYSGEGIVSALNGWLTGTSAELVASTESLAVRLRQECCENVSVNAK